MPPIMSSSGFRGEYVLVPTGSGADEVTDADIVEALARRNRASTRDAIAGGCRAAFRRRVYAATG